jgi:hypothetical protein
MRELDDRRRAPPPLLSRNSALTLGSSTVATHLRHCRRVPPPGHGARQPTPRTSATAVAYVRLDFGLVDRRRTPPPPPPRASVKLVDRRRAPPPLPPHASVELVDRRRTPPPLPSRTSASTLNSSTDTAHLRLAAAYLRLDFELIDRRRAPSPLPPRTSASTSSPSTGIAPCPPPFGFSSLVPASTFTPLELCTGEALCAPVLQVRGAEVSMLNIQFRVFYSCTRLA